MGKLEDNSSVNHFSHEHPLQLQNLQSQITTKATCLACNVSVSGSLFYTCYSCNFYLHKECSNNLYTTLKHRCDQSHDLVFLSSPAYPEGVFNCNACGYNGRGFSYHCPDCQLDLHVVCASMPPSVNHTAHGHTLGLCFKPPYENQGFSCDICKQPGSNHWLYRCGLCDFDAHMKCAMARTTSRSILPKSTSLPARSAAPPPSPPIQIYYTIPQVQNPQVLMSSTSLPPHVNYHFPPPPPPSPPIVQPYYSQVRPAMGVPQYAQSPRQASFVNNMAGHAVEGVVGSVAQEILQAVFEGAIS